MVSVKNFEGSTSGSDGRVLKSQFKGHRFKTKTLREGSCSSSFSKEHSLELNELLSYESQIDQLLRVLLNHRSLSMIWVQNLFKEKCYKLDGIKRCASVAIKLYEPGIHSLSLSLSPPPLLPLSLTLPLTRSLYLPSPSVSPSQSHSAALFVTSVLLDALIWQTLHSLI